MGNGNGMVNGNDDKRLRKRFGPETQTVTATVWSRNTNGHDPGTVPVHVR
jgi:hypothetical protein